MNFILAALLFLLAWWFADQGEYFFAMVFIIALVLTAISSAARPRAGGAPAGQAAPAAAPVAQPSPPNWDNTQIEAFGRNLGRVIEIPLRLLWAIAKYLWGNK